MSGLQTFSAFLSPEFDVSVCRAETSSQIIDVSSISNVKCAVFLAFYEIKLNIFFFWTASRTKQDV